MPVLYSLALALATNPSAARFLILTSQIGCATAANEGTSPVQGSILAAATLIALAVALSSSQQVRKRQQRQQQEDKQADHILEYDDSTPLPNLEGFPAFDAIPKRIRGLSVVATAPQSHKCCSLAALDKSGTLVSQIFSSGKATWLGLKRDDVNRLCERATTDHAVRWCRGSSLGSANTVFAYKRNGQNMVCKEAPAGCCVPVSHVAMQLRGRQSGLSGAVAGGDVVPVPNWSTGQLLPRHLEHCVSCQAAHVFLMSAVIGLGLPSEDEALLLLDATRSAVNSLVNLSDTAGVENYGLIQSQLEACGGGGVNWHAPFHHGYGYPTDMEALLYVRRFMQR
jgi:hypothetical protein